MLVDLRHRAPDRVRIERGDAQPRSDRKPLGEAERPDLAHDDACEFLADMPLERFEGGLHGLFDPVPGGIETGLHRLARFGEAGEAIGAGHPVVIRQG